VKDRWQRRPCANQVVAAIRGWAENNVVGLETEKRTRDVTGVERGRIAPDQDNSFGTLLELALEEISHALAQFVALLGPQCVTGRDMLIEPGSAVGRIVGQDQPGRPRKDGRVHEKIEQVEQHRPRDGCGCGFSNTGRKSRLDASGNGLPRKDAERRGFKEGPTHEARFPAG
jgi:hypothetical protein